MTNEKAIATTREALMAQLLQDVDGLIQRFEAADTSIAGRIEKATREASTSALGATRADLGRFLAQEGSSLLQGARDASRVINQQLVANATEVFASNAAVIGKGRFYMAFLVFCSLFSGVAASVSTVLLMR